MSTVKKINGILVPNTFVTGFTYNDANLLTISQNGQNDLSVNLNYFSGLTITGDVSTYTLSSDTIYITSALINNNSNTQLLTRNTSTGKIEYRDSSSISGGASGDYLPLSGGTVTGGTTFTSGVTANTISNVQYIDFNLTANTTHQEGRVHWNDDIKSLEIDTENPEVQLEVGHELVLRVNNQTGSAIPKGRAVYIDGEQGQRPTIRLASFTADTTSASVVGLTMAQINNNNNGYVILNGLLVGSISEPLDTSSYSAGTPLYLLTGGTLTDIKPQAPDHDVRIGKVVVSNLTTGSIYVQIQNGYELDELHDVRITNKTTGDLITLSAYNGTDVWVNSKTLNGSYTITGSTSINNGLFVTGNTTLQSFTAGTGIINDNLTVTGNTTIGLGLTANTVSASTYYNLPYVTGGTATYTGVSGSILLTYNTGQTFTVTGLTDEKTTGGTYSNGVYIFTTNSGNTYQVSSTTTYSAGIISGSTGWLNNSGEINLPAVKVALFNNSNNIEPIFVYDIPSGTTGSDGIPSLTNNSTNYVVIEYNGGSPRYNVYNNDTSNDSDVVLSYIVYRLNTVIHVLEFGNYGAGLANKLNDRLVMTDRFGWESGVSLGLSGSTGIVTLSSGVVWNGSYRQSLDEVNSQDDFFFKNYHVSSAWTYNITGDTINNTYYDNLINIVSGTTGKYLVNYYYRGQETNDHLYEVYSQAEYDSVNEAEGAPNPTLPELITSHAFLVGRIIVQVGQTTGLTQTAFSTVFLPSGYASSSGFHNDLLGIDGGTAGQYYHLNQIQYNNVAYQNSGNTFTQNQIINASLSANTITINNTPNFNNQNTQILTRNSTNGNIEYSDSSSANVFNYGLANAMVNLNFLT